MRAAKPDFWVARRPNAGPRRSAQLVNFWTPFLPGNPTLNTRRRRQKTLRRNLITPPPPPPHEFLPRSRNPDFRIPRTTSPEIACSRVGPKSGDLRAGRLSNAGPRRPAHLVNFRTLFCRKPSRKHATETSENAPAADCALARNLARLGSLLPAGYPSPVPIGTFRLPPAARFWLPLASHAF